MMTPTVRNLLATLLLLPIANLASASAPDAIIVTAPGGATDEDDAIGLTFSQIEGVGGPDLLRALGTHVAGLSISEVQGNSFQPDIVYRGFSASPLQGSSQGLAMYLDGGRFNLPFGDTVAMDLLPDVAVNTVSLRDNNPLYGLNALGGALVIATHSGQSAPGLSAGLGIGDHGRREAELAFGARGKSTSLFVAGEVQRDDGWRAFSPSKLTRGFADAGWDGEKAGLHVKLLGAETRLTGNGSAPVELLAAKRSAVFTHPDETHNRMVRGSVHPWIALGSNDRIEASLYAQNFRQKTRNGDLADIAPCSVDPSLLCLESNDDEASLLDQLGQEIPPFADVDDYGVFNRTATRSTAAGVVLHYVRSGDIMGQAHELTLGLSHDRTSSRFAAETELGALDKDRGVAGLGPIIRQADRAIAPIGLDVRTRATGLFLGEQIDLGRGLSAELALRWNDVRIDMEDQIGVALTGKHRFRRLNPGLELDYQLSPKLALRLGYAETNRAPTPAELSCADEAAPCSLTNFFVADPPLDQVVAKSWEAGASGNWAAAGWSGNWSLSAYRTGISNDLLLTAAETRGRAFFRNIGQTRRSGLDIGLRTQRAPWSLDLGYSYSRAIFRAPFTAVSPDNPAADDEGRIEIAPGAHLPGIPRNRVVAGVSYQAGRLTVKARVQAQSGQWRRGDEANEDALLPGFFRADLGGAWTLGKGVSAFVDVTNVFNRRYASFGTYTETDEIFLAEVPVASDPRADTPGAPRRFLIGLRLRH